MKLSKLVFPAIIISAIGLIYYTYFAPTKELGSFSNFGGSSEINQKIHVAVVKSKIERGETATLLLSMQRIKIKL